MEERGTGLSKSSVDVTIAIQAELLGSFRLRHGSADVRPRTRKTAGILAYLISNDRGGSSRARLANLLWSDRGEQQARASLRQALFEIRSCGLEGWVRVSRTDVELVQDRFESDIGRIAQMAVNGDGASLAAVLAQIDGVFLDDLDGLSPAFDDWLQPERTRQRDRLFAVSLKCAIDAISRKTGKERQILAELERLDPLDEAVVRMCLQIDYAAGDIAAVHRRYRRFTDRLVQELSAAPSRETRDLFETMTAASSPLLASSFVRAEGERASLDGHAPPLISIFPFRCDGDGELVRFIQTLADRIAESLGRSSELRVVLAETVPDDELPEILRRSVASFSLRGSARKIGDAIALNVQLTNAHTAQLVWSEGFDIGAASLNEIGPLVERISGAMGPATDREIGGNGGNAGATHLYGLDEPSALYFHGKRLVRDARSLDAVRAGMDVLAKVLALDPGHIGAKLRLAQLYNTDFHYLMAGHDVAEMREQAMRLTFEAAAQQPDSPHVRLRLAWCLLRRGDWEGTRSLLKEIEARMPHDPDLMNECGFARTMLGELDVGRGLLQRAFRLNPFPRAEYHADLAVLLALAGEHDTAEAHFGLCGEQRLFWRVVRLCNLYRLGGATPQLMALDGHFVSTFRSIWVGPAPPSLTDLLTWGRTIFCFRLEEHQVMIAEGLTAAWAARMQEGGDNVSSTAGEHSYPVPAKAPPKPPLDKARLVV